MFSRNAIFTGVRIPNPGVIFDFKGATFDKVVFDLASLRRIYPQDQNEVLQKLEEKFRDQEQLDLANQAYYMRMVFHRNNDNNWLVRTFEIIFLDILKTVVDLLPEGNGVEFILDRLVEAFADAVGLR